MGTDNDIKLCNWTITSQLNNGLVYTFTNGAAIDRIDKDEKKEPEVDPEVKSTLTKNNKGKLCATFYKDGFKTSTKELIPDIKDVIVHNNCVVIVEFTDGTSEKQYFIQKTTSL